MDLSQKIYLRKPLYLHCKSHEERNRLVVLVILSFYGGILIFVCHQSLPSMKRAVFSIMSSVLALSLFAWIVVGCGTEEPIPTPTPDPTPKPTTVPVTGVSLDKTVLSLVEGASEALTATVSPENASNKSISWKSSATDVATVDDSGKVTAVKEGSATVTVTTADGSKTATCSVTVTEAAKIVITGNTAKVPVQGGTAEFPIQYNTSYTVVIESSAQAWLHFVETKAMQSGTLVFKVDANEGAARTGKATVKDNEGKLDPITLAFEQDAFIAVSSVQIAPETAELEVGETLTLTATVLPDDATDKTVTWSSDKESVATVSESGVVTGKTDGSAIITATAGEQTASCVITVKPSAYESERAALEVFYRANNGDKWTHNDNWCTDAPLGEWYGVAMTLDGKHVRAIDFWGNGVEGFIPEDIADLTELERLNITNYYYSSNAWPLPEAIGSLKKLKFLQFQSYTLGGVLPESLFTMKNLEVLRIRNAEGMSPAPIPPAVGNLTNLTELDLSIMNLTGDIPPEIGYLTNLTDLALFGNKLTGSIPDSFGNLVNLETFNLQDNQLSGEIPPAFYRVRNYWMLWPELVIGNGFTQDDIRNAKIPAPKSPPVTLVSGNILNLEEAFKKNQYTVIVNTGPEHESWDIVPSLLTLYNSNKDKGLGVIMSYDNNYLEPGEIDAHDKAFKDLLKSYNVTWDTFIRHMYDTDPSAKEGKTSPYYTKWGHKMYPLGAMDEIVVIGPDQTVQYATLADHSIESRSRLQHFMEYISAVFDSPIVRYESQDYSADGKVSVLQQASVGMGVDLVITGDGYSDRLIADGTFSKAVEQAVCDFFSIEPYKSLRDRFNVYQVDAVSRNEEFFNGCSTALSGGFVGATTLTGDNSEALRYAAAAIDESRMDDVVVIVLVNSGLSGGTAYMMDAETNHYASGASVAWIPYKNMTVNEGISRNAMVLIHEAGGHGFGKLNDEYSINYYGGPDQEMIDYIKACHKRNVFVNVDVTDDPKEVLWSRFIGDDRFSKEQIGVYKGGGSFFDGIWRPTENSVMRTNSLNKNNFFNAPSRAQIYTRIMKLSEGQDWQFDYETFVKWDQAHPTKLSVAPATRSNYVEVDDAENDGHVPPVILSKTWREVIHR